MRQRLRATLLAVLLVPVCACSALGRRQDVDMYTLALPPPTEDVPRRDVAWQLEVLEPQALASLLGTGIGVLQPDRRHAVYRGARWSDTPTLQLQALLVQALREAGVAGAAGSASPQRADCLLESELRTLQAEYRGGAAPVATLTLDVRLIRVADGRVVASRSYSDDEPASTPALRDVVDALQRSAGRTVRAVARWTLDAACGATDAH